MYSYADAGGELITCNDYASSEKVADDFSIYYKLMSTNFNVEQYHHNRTLQQMMTERSNTYLSADYSYGVTFHTE